MRLANLYFNFLSPLVSRLLGALSRTRFPRAFRMAALRRFVAAYGVDLAAATRRLDEYPTFDAFFTRDVWPELRPIDGMPDAICSPADARVAQCGDVEDGTLLQAKGLHYTLSALLADPDLGARFAAGSYATFYLAPQDCHHVFAPRQMAATRAVHVPGRLFPVRPPFSTDEPGLYTRNERVVVASADTAVVLVGAANVGFITLEFDRTISSSRTRLAMRTYPGIPVERGAKLGTFHLGSTVVLLTASRVHWRPGLEGQTVRYGETIGTV